jgi:hypothetical protein
MKGGNKNMKFYHTCANQRRKVNNIDSIKDENVDSRNLKQKLRKLL